MPSSFPAKNSFHASFMRSHFVRKSMILRFPYYAALQMYISQKPNQMSPALLMRFLICSNEEKKIMLISAERPTLTPRPVLFINWCSCADVFNRLTSIRSRLEELDVGTRDLSATCFQLALLELSLDDIDRVDLHLD
jgi:hypothetical protein